MNAPVTLSIDIGGSGLKASALDSDGKMLHDRVRTLTPYPLSPAALVQALEQLIVPLPAFDRVSVGFPGVVRDGHVLSAPQFVTSIRHSSRSGITSTSPARSPTRCIGRCAC
jgi:polyphosphate glucokinase